MIHVEKVETYGWETAIRGMRNPLNSWDKSDTSFFSYPRKGVAHSIGKNDLSLMKRLSVAGNDHGKYLRMITVTCDITAPLYWWKEYDTYKVGTVANSCSTMHKIADKEFTLDDFSHEHLHTSDWDDELSVIKTRELVSTPLGIMELILIALNNARQAYLETGDKKILVADDTASSCVLQSKKRTVQLNYAVLKNIYHSRRNHKLDEWCMFCSWIETLPYSELITG